jgi:hypothetical protein
MCDPFRVAEPIEGFAIRWLGPPFWNRPGGVFEQLVHEDRQTPGMSGSTKLQAGTMDVAKARPGGAWGNLQSSTAT